MAKQGVYCISLRLQRCNPQMPFRRNFLCNPMLWTAREGLSMLGFLAQDARKAASFGLVAPTERAIETALLGGPAWPCLSAWGLEYCERCQRWVEALSF